MPSHLLISILMPPFHSPFVHCKAIIIIIITTAESSISTPSIGTTQPSCPNGMIFADRCGRECEIVTSCDNYQNRAFCDFHCEQNCYCPDGMVEHNGECVEPSVCPGMML